MSNMRYFKTRAAFKPEPGREITWLYGVKYTHRGPVEVKVGCCWHRWEQRTTHWFVWNAKRSESVWLSAPQEKFGTFR